MTKPKQNGSRLGTNLRLPKKLNLVKENVMSTKVNDLRNSS